MLWQEEDEDIQYKVPDTVQDIIYKIDCKNLPIDHAWELSQAVLTHLPWIADEEFVGIHQIHVAESGNGWFRPDSDDQLLCLSKRTKFSLRVPKHRIDEALALQGQILDIHGHRLEVKTGQTKKLSDLGTIFARYVVTEHEDEEQALSQMLGQVQDMGIRVKKALCGKTHYIRTPDGRLMARSLMLSGLQPDQSVMLQERGLGEYQTLGCGLFLPHKGIEAVATPKGGPSG